LDEEEEEEGVCLRLGQNLRDRIVLSFKQSFIDLDRLRVNLGPRTQSTAGKERVESSSSTHSSSPTASSATMPRLQILVHKSYHPYLQSNKDKVAKDEKEQKERDQREELRVLQAVRSLLLPPSSSSPASLVQTLLLTRSTPFLVIFAGLRSPSFPPPSPRRSQCCSSGPPPSTSSELELNFLLLFRSFLRLGGR